MPLRRRRPTQDELKRAIDLEVVNLKATTPLDELARLVNQLMAEHGSRDNANFVRKTISNRIGGTTRVAEAWSRIGGLCGHRQAARIYRDEGESYRDLATENFERGLDVSPGTATLLLVAPTESVDDLHEALVCEYAEFIAQQDPLAAIEYLEGELRVIHQVEEEEQHEYMILRTLVDLIPVEEPERIHRTWQRLIAVDGRPFAFIEYGDWLAKIGDLDAAMTAYERAEWKLVDHGLALRHGGPSKNPLIVRIYKGLETVAEGRVRREYADGNLSPHAEIADENSVARRSVEWNRMVIVRSALSFPLSQGDYLSAIDILRAGEPPENRTAWEDEFLGDLYDRMAKMDSDYDPLTGALERDACGQKFGEAAKYYSEAIVKDSRRIWLWEKAWLAWDNYADYCKEAAERCLVMKDVERVETWLADERKARTSSERAFEQYTSTSLIVAVPLGSRDVVERLAVLRGAPEQLSVANVVRLLPPARLTAMGLSARDVQLVLRGLYFAGVEETGAAPPLSPDAFPLELNREVIVIVRPGIDLKIVGKDRARDVVVATAPQGAFGPGEDDRAGEGAWRMVADLAECTNYIETPATDSQPERVEISFAEVHQTAPINARIFLDCSTKLTVYIDEGVTKASGERLDDATFVAPVRNQTSLTLRELTGDVVFAFEDGTVGARLKLAYNNLATRAPLAYERDALSTIRVTAGSIESGAHTGRVAMQAPDAVTDLIERKDNLGSVDRHERGDGGGDLGPTNDRDDPPAHGDGPGGVAADLPDAPETRQLRDGHPPERRGDGRPDAGTPSASRSTRLRDRDGPRLARLTAAEPTRVAPSTARNTRGPGAELMGATLRLDVPGR